MCFFESVCNESPEMEELLPRQRSGWAGFLIAVLSAAVVAAVVVGLYMLTVKSWYCVECENFYEVVRCENCYTYCYPNTTFICDSIIPVAKDVWYFHDMARIACK